jgi:hypothetical protein
MKNLSVKLAALSLSLALFPALAAPYYVAPGGDDGAAGTAAAPFASLERARDAVRAARAAGGADSYEVLLLPGSYLLPSSFKLGAADAGTAAAPMIYRAAEPGTARLLGSRPIPASAFQPVTDAAVLALLEPAAAQGVLVADLAALGFPQQREIVARSRGGTTELPELFCNDERMQLARWPDADWAEVAAIIEGGAVPRTGKSTTNEHPGGIFQYHEERPARWSVERGIWLRGYWCFDWSESVIKASMLDLDKKQIGLSEPHNYGLRQGNPSPRRWYALNMLEELTQPGEFYVDAAANKLYFWPPVDLASAKITFTTNKGALIEVDGTDDLCLQGLVLAEAGSGIQVKNSSRLRIEGCTVRNMHHVGISVQGGRDHVLRSCDVHDTGTGGIALHAGDYKTLARGDSLIENCHIWRFAVHKLTYSNGITLAGVGNCARHNLLHDAPHMAIGGGGNDNIFEYNVVHHVCLAADDSGAYYKGRNPARRGNIIRYNFWHSIGKPMGHGVAAVYFDDGDGGDAVIGNLFFRCGDPGKGSFGTVFNHGGHDILADNNIFIECKRPLGSSPWNNKRWRDAMNSKLYQDRLTKEVDIRKPPYTTHYPALLGYFDEKLEEPRVSTARRNLLLMCAEPKSGNWQLDESNWITDEDPGFVDINGGDFNFKQDAAVFTRIPGFEPLPLAKMGLYVDRWRQQVEREEWNHAPPRPLPPLKQTRSAARGPVVAKGAAPVFAATRIAVAPRIDGQVDEAEWGGLPLEGAMLLAQHYDGSSVAANRQSRAWLRYDEQTLYVLVRSQIDPTTALNGNSWGSDDAVEVSMRPLPAAGAAQPAGAARPMISVLRAYGNGFLWFGVTADGAEEPLSQEVNPCVFAMSRPSPGEWVAELAIPFSKVDLSAAQAGRCAFNITVRKAKDNLWLMWESTRSNSYNADAAGILEWK